MMTSSSDVIITKENLEQAIKDAMTEVIARLDKLERANDARRQEEEIYEFDARNTWVYLFFLLRRHRGDDELARKIKERKLKTQ